MEVDLGQKTKWMKIKNKDKRRTDNTPFDDDSQFSEEEEEEEEVIEKNFPATNDREEWEDGMDLDSREEGGNLYIQREEENDDDDYSDEEDSYTLESSRRRKRLPSFCMGSFVTCFAIILVGGVMATTIILFLRDSGFGGRGSNFEQNTRGTTVPTITTVSTPVASPVDTPVSDNSTMAPTPTPFNALWFGIGRLTNDRYKNISHAALSVDGNNFVAVFPNTPPQPPVAQVYSISDGGLFPLGGEILNEGEGLEDPIMAMDMNVEASQVALSYQVLGIGYVRVFQNLLSGWTPFANVVFTANTDDDYGLAIALSGFGNNLAVAATKEDGGKGMVYIYDFDGVSNRWALNPTSPKGTEEGEMMGLALDFSLDGSKLAIVSKLSSANNNLESVQLYSVDEQKMWNKMGNSIQRVPPPPEFYTNSISLSNNGRVLAVSNGVSSSGQSGVQPTTIVYTLVGGANTFWSQRGVSLVGDGVSLSGDGSAVVVSTFSDKSTTAYQWQTDTWVQMGFTKVGLNQVKNTGGVSMSSNGMRMMIYEDLEFKSNVGFRSRIRLFQFGKN